MSKSFLSNIFPWMGGQREKEFLVAADTAAVAVVVSPPANVLLTAAGPASVSAGDCSSNSSNSSNSKSDTSSNNNARKKRSRTPDLVYWQKRRCGGDDNTNNNMMNINKRMEDDDNNDDDADDGVLPSRPHKFFRGQTRAIAVEPSPLVEKLSDDLLLKCLSYVGGKEDRFAVQCTSRTFRRLTNTKEILKHVNVDQLLIDQDTPGSAADKLEPFAAAGNLPALYMLGTIRTYCYPDVEQGISLLKVASSSGYVPAHYTLGLVLRDSSPGEAEAFMQKAVDSNYFPALQEVLSDSELKKQLGDRPADELLGYMDPCCLSRLLCRHYCFAKCLRAANTSHCWNPKCGRWAFRGDRKTSSSSVVSRMKVCSRCCRAKYCSKLCQVYDWRSGRHQTECQYL